jgi:hypothetical protein
LRLTSRCIAPYQPLYCALLDTRRLDLRRLHQQFHRLRHHQQQNRLRLRGSGKHSQLLALRIRGNRLLMLDRVQAP